MILALVIILILILFLMCILLIPFDIYLNLSLRELKIEGYFKLTWIKINLLKRNFPGEKKEKQRKAEKKQKIDLKRLPKIISLLYEASPYLINIFKAFIKEVNFKRFNVKLRLGFSSSYDTAVISGFICSLMPIINLIPQLSFLFEPDFANERIEANLNLKFTVKLWSVVVQSLIAITKKPVRSLLNELRKLRS